MEQLRENIQIKGNKRITWWLENISYYLFSLIFKFYPYHLSPKHLERIQKTRPATVIHHQAFWLVSQEQAPAKEWTLLVLMCLYKKYSPSTDDVSVSFLKAPLWHYTFHVLSCQIHNSATWNSSLWDTSNIGIFSIN